MGYIIGQKIDYNGVGALRGQRHIPSKHKPKYPSPPPRVHRLLYIDVIGDGLDYAFRYHPNYDRLSLGHSPRNSRSTYQRD